ncbi:hypothetical protein SESBI_06400 [Sesbania bispinosa]|nr:hypothetical protein SESBI_06400 [Sesbania bispinosa]
MDQPLALILTIVASQFSTHHEQRLEVCSRQKHILAQPQASPTPALVPAPTSAVASKSFTLSPLSCVRVAISTKNEPIELDLELKL